MKPGRCLVHDKKSGERHGERTIFRQVGPAAAKTAAWESSRTTDMHPSTCCCKRETNYPRKRSRQRTSRDATRMPGRGSSDSTKASTRSRAMQGTRSLVDHVLRFIDGALGSEGREEQSLKETVLAAYGEGARGPRPTSKWQSGTRRWGTRRRTRRDRAPAGSSTSSSRSGGRATVPTLPWRGSAHSCVGFGTAATEAVVVKTRSVSALRQGARARVGGEGSSCRGSCPTAPTERRVQGTPHAIVGDLLAEGSGHRRAGRLPFARTRR